MFTKLKLYNMIGNNIKFFVLCTPKTYFNSDLIYNLFKEHDLVNYLVIKPCGNLHELIEKSFENAQDEFLKIIQNIIKRNNKKNNFHSNVIIIFI